jgi:predicted nucleotidyltransferase
MSLYIEVFGLDFSTVSKIRGVLKNISKIDKAILYGSRAMGSYRSGSDIDLTFKGEKIGLNDLLQFESEIDDLMTPYSFDVSVFSQIENQQLIGHIDRVGVIFYERES